MMTTYPATAKPFLARPNDAPSPTPPPLAAERGSTLAPTIFCPEEHVEQCLRDAQLSERSTR